jgi:uncharacterized damage-inducible protein DinB
MGPADLKELFRHMEWADAEVWRAVRAAPAASADEMLHKLLLHLHGVQRFFLEVWRDRPLAHADPAAVADLLRLHTWSQSYYGEASAFLHSLDEAALTRPVVMPWADEFARKRGMPPRRPTLAETIFQVTSHSTYHRGQVNARLRAVGGEPPLVDYIAWIWFGRPDAAPCEVASEN